MIIYILLSILTGLIIGFNLGYIMGKDKGVKIGHKEAPLLLKEESLKNGYCLICNNKNTENHAG